MVPIVIGIAVIYLIISIIVTIIRNALALAGMFRLYPVALALALVLSIALFILLGKKGFNKRGRLCFIAFILLTVLGFFGATGIYNTANIYFPAQYMADYILADSDGSLPVFSSRRGGKGETLSALSAGQRVTVNGISFNKKDFNITTKDGVTGWVAAAAFPANARDWIFDQAETSGEVSVDIQKDRLLEQLARRYLNEETKGYFTMSDRVLRNMIRVNAEAPIYFLSGTEHRNSRRGETSELRNTGDKVTLTHIAYAPDCTIIWVAARKPSDPAIFSYDLHGWFNSREWRTSLFVTCLDTGERWQVIQGDYTITSYTGDDFSSTLFFFPPFRTRHFSLTFEASPLPPRRQAGFGGMFGWLSRVIGRGGMVEYIDYSFPEVRVRQPAGRQFAD